MTASKNLIQASAGVGGGDFYPYTVDYSARFNDNDSPKLTRTNGSSATSNQKFTYSTWFKRCTNGLQQSMFYAGNTGGSTNLFAPQMWTDDRFRVVFDGAGAYIVYTPGVLRDNSAWYHIVVAVDTTQATSTNRCKIYINGEQQTVTGTQPPQNHAINMGASDVMAFSDAFSSRFIDGYKAQDVYIDGQQLLASDFGEEKNGIWVPKDVSGLTFGTLGAYLDFGNSAALGTDVSGNGNNFTSSGLTSSDQMIDTPTNNFCTMNPNDADPDASTSDGNLVVSIPNASYGAIRGTLGVSSGKFYYEYTVGSTPGLLGVATSNASITDYPGADSEGWSVFGFNGQKYNGTPSTYAGAWTTNDVISVAVDMDAGSIYFAKNGDWANGTGSWNQTFANAVAAFTNLSGSTVVPAGGAPSNASYGLAGTFNFGQTNFTYTPPTDYLAWATANLPEPTIGPNSATTSDENFNAVLWTGTSSARTITGYGFQPDFLWTKCRNVAESHRLHDAVRGGNGTVLYELNSNEISAEGTDTLVSGFTADGFAIEAGGNTPNVSGRTYVGWAWKGNGSGVSNTDGSITSTVSANTDAGISIITYTGTGSAATVGHGLGVTPSVVIVKNRTDVNTNWRVYHQNANASPASGNLFLNSTSAFYTDSACWNNTLPTSSVFSIGTTPDTNTNTKNYLAYVFAEVEGFSSFGSYTGNSSADGPFIYTGMRPAFVITKRTDTSGYGWVVMDAGRDQYNVADAWLYADSSSAEVSNSSTRIDFLSNGFKLRGDSSTQNASGGNYIYMAFAENPFKYSRGR